MPSRSSAARAAAAACLAEGRGSWLEAVLARVADGRRVDVDVAEQALFEHVADEAQLLLADGHDLQHVDVRDRLHVAAARYGR